MTRAECLKRARESEELAKLVWDDDEAKETILRIAEGWRELAEQRENQFRPKNAA